MGHPYGVAFKLPVLKTSPITALQFFDKLFYEGDAQKAFNDLLAYGCMINLMPHDIIDPKNPVMDAIDYFSLMVNGHNASFEAWYQNIKEETDTIILYETYHSCKYPRSEFVLHLLNSLIPSLYLKEGDIVYRTIGDEDRRESIIYLKDEVFVLSGTDGWLYGDCYDDDNHPRNHVSSHKYEYDFKGDRRSREDISFDLPWNVVELKKQQAIEEVKRLESKSNGWW